MVDQSKLDSLNSELELNMISLFLGKSSSIPATKAELKLVRNLLEEDLKTQKIEQGKGGSLDMLTQMLTDTWFNAIGVKTVKLPIPSLK